MWSIKPEAIGTASEPDKRRGRPRLRFGPNIYWLVEATDEDVVVGGWGEEDLLLDVTPMLGDIRPLNK